MKKCKGCDKIVKTKTKTNHQKFCSYKCRCNNYKKRYNELKRIRTGKNRSKLIKFKRQTGCERCGYNEHGGSIDFHHLDKSKKEQRIKGDCWKSESNIKEIKKCILLCKNCHFWIHSLEQQNYEKIINKYVCAYKRLIQWELNGTKK